jgi:endonuclease YncB( thermonuclease family)
MKQLLIATYCLVLALSTQASELTGKVVSVSDGDTLRVLVDDHQIKIRLGGIDAPESNQPFGQASKRYLAEAVAGQTVVVEFEKKDRYGRVIGKVLLDGADMNLRQVEAGYAWWYEYYKRDQSEADQQAYAAAEQQARGSRVGLWSEPAPINPYDWRQGKRGSVSATDAESFQCGEKRYCNEMSSCAEAKFHLASCGLTKLDGDGDGTPCESLCR